MNIEQIIVVSKVIGMVLRTIPYIWKVHKKSGLREADEKEDGDFLWTISYIWKVHKRSGLREADEKEDGDFL